MEFVTSEWGISSRILSLPYEYLLILVMSYLVNLTIHQVHKAFLFIYLFLYIFFKYPFNFVLLPEADVWVFRERAFLDRISGPSSEKLESVKHFTAKNSQAPSAAVANWAEAKWFSFQERFSCSESTPELLVWKEQPVHGHPCPHSGCRAYAAVGSVCCCGAEEGRAGPPGAGKIKQSLPKKKLFYKTSKWELGEECLVWL